MSTDLILLEPKNPALVFVANGCDPIIDHIREEVRKEQPNLDISTAAGRKAIASLAYKIAGAKTKLDKIGLTLTNDQRLAIDAVNAERNRVWTELEKLQAEVRAPLTAWEKADEDRITAHEAALAHLSSLAVWPTETFNPTAQAIKERIDASPAAFDRAWEEFNARAIQTHEIVTKGLQRQYEAAVKHETEQAELARLRAEELARQQKERDDRIAAEARQKAEAEAESKRAAEAERVSREKREAAEAAAAREIAERERADKAERDRVAAMEQAERDRITAADRAEREKREAADRAAQQERDRIAKEKADDEKAAQAREADIAHKKKINNEILNGLMGINEKTGKQCLNSDLAKDIITAIAQGKVPHVKITY